jgi:phosphocarrier protein HPr
VLQLVLSCCWLGLPQERLPSRCFELHAQGSRNVNKLGLHARPAAQFVRCVIRFKSTVTICKGEENFSADSMLEVLSANLNRGDRVVLEAVGPDEQEALNELEALLLRFRDEESGAQGN